MIKKIYKKVSILTILFSTIFCSKVFATKKQEKQNQNLINNIADEEIKENKVLIFPKKIKENKILIFPKKNDNKGAYTSYKYKRINYNKIKLKNLEKKIKNMNKQQFYGDNKKTIYKNPNPTNFNTICHNNHIIYPIKNFNPKVLHEHLKKFKIFQKLFKPSNKKLKNINKNQPKTNSLKYIAKKENYMPTIVKTLKDLNKTYNIKTHQPQQIPLNLK